MASHAYVTLDLGDDAEFRIGDPTHDGQQCRVYAEIEGGRTLALLWLSRQSADALIAAVREAKERAWPAPPGIEADPVLAATGEEEAGPRFSAVALGEEADTDWAVWDELMHGPMVGPGPVFKTKVDAEREADRLNAEELRREAEASEQGGEEG